MASGLRARDPMFGAISPARFMHVSPDGGLKTVLEEQPTNAESQEIALHPLSGNSVASY